MNLDVTNFSSFGSYMSIEYKEEEGFLLKSLHGVSKPHMKSMKLIPTFRGEHAACSYEADYDQIRIEHENGQIEICFHKADEILIKGRGKQSGMVLDTLPMFNFEYSYLLGTPQEPYIVINSYKNLTRYLVYTLSGRLDLCQEVQYDAAGSQGKAQSSSSVIIEADGQGEFLFIIKDIQTHNAIPEKLDVDYTQALERSRKEWFRYMDCFPEVPGMYQESFREAVYILWSSTAGVCKNLRYPSVYASINHFPGVWSWDHCFIALGLAKGHPKLALEQFAVVFDHQDELGQIPGSVSDSTIRWNFCKPPVHGYILSKILPVLGLSPEQKRTVFYWLKKQADYYLKYKDSNRDGICEYYHGNDSGQDNSTVFQGQVPVDSPDLNAYLICCLDFLEDLALELNLIDEGKECRENSDRLMDKFLNFFFEDNLPVAKNTFTGETIRSGSILPYICLILGKKLPEDIRHGMIRHLKEHHLTKWGLATEAVDSPDYASDAYWRGPVWAPTTFLMVEALKDCGEDALGAEISRSFCEMVRTHGFAENFDAETGEGLRDKSFSWTAAVFLYFASGLESGDAEIADRN